MNLFEAIIFDMDGVIVDSEPRHERAFREIFTEMGYAETHGMDFAAYYGRSDRALWLDFIAKHRPSQALEQLASWKQRRFLEIIKHEQPIFAGLPELVEKLSRRYKLGVASGSFHPVIDEVLALRDLRRFFPIVVSVQDVAQGKPAPDVFLRTAELLAVPAPKCCVIEDAAAGVEAALAAGMKVIAITNSLPKSKLARATRVVSTYDEIDHLLLNRGWKA
ncbi:MAG: HAD family phosphatase [Verrucomicrobiota bacterium]